MMVMEWGRIEREQRAALWQWLRDGHLPEAHIVADLDDAVMEGTSSESPPDRHARLTAASGTARRARRPRAAWLRRRRPRVPSRAR